MKQQWTRQGLGAALLLAAVAAGCTETPAMGTGGVTAAAGTGAAGMAVSAAGAGGATTSTATPAGPFACGPMSTKAPAEIYAAVAAAYLPTEASPMLPCAFGSCHNASKKAAQLQLTVGMNLAELVGKQSCESPNLKLVEAGGGDAALAKSWLYQKLAAPVDGSAALVPDPAWGMPGQCGQMGDFGMRMPISGGPDGVGEAKLAVMKEWICAGAPGPM
ncbi:MAG TPA: hypothetical protein VFN67_05840 [Polyangiales bacterium]|nr:hypothetical protein [Polyangiales bacterium]